MMRFTVSRTCVVCAFAAIVLTSPLHYFMVASAFCPTILDSNPMVFMKPIHWPSGAGSNGVGVLGEKSRRFRISIIHALENEDLGMEGYDDDDEEEDGYDDDELEIKPYGNRSLAWTKRYRKLNPYEKVRDRVIRNFGHRSKEDWDECVANGWQGQYVPSRPDEMYAPEWISWDEFLGIMRSYDDARNLAVNVLCLKSLDDYIVFVRSDSKRAEGLRIPVRPDLFYKGKGWVDEATFFAKDEEEIDSSSSSSRDVGDYE